MKHSQSSQAKEKLDTLLRQYAEYNGAMTEEEKDIRIKELEEFLEDVIEHPYMCGSYIWKEGWELLNKNKDE